MFFFLKHSFLPVIHGSAIGVEPRDRRVYLKVYRRGSGIILEAAQVTAQHAQISLIWQKL